jgi:hypothetical protein
MHTFTVIAHFTYDINDEVKFDVLSPDGTERVIESRSVDWSVYAESPLDAVYRDLIESRWLGYGPTFDNARHGSREIYATNHDTGQNFVVVEVDYDTPTRSAPV